MNAPPAGPGTPVARPASPRTAPVAAVVVATLCGPAVAAPPAPPCGDAIAVLNEGKAWEAFDRDSGAGTKRLRFRLEGWEPCPGGACTAAGHGPEAPQSRTDTKPDAGPETRPAETRPAETKPDTPATGNAGTGPDAAANAAKPDAKPEAKPDTKPGANPVPAPETRVATRIDIVAPGAGSDKVVASVDIRGRSVSYCFLGANRIDARPDPHRTGCPGSYLRNFLQIRLVDADGPFARRDVDIDYLYRPDTVAVSLDRCAPPRILDGMFRRRTWTVTLADGAAVHIGETNFPRDRRAAVPQDAPFATSVPGATPE